METADDDRTEPISSSLQEYGRGIAGGLLFSLPLLYTMEVWWAGFQAESWMLLVCVGVTFLLLLGYNRYGGIRQDAHRLDIVIDSIEEFGIGILLATLVLFLLERVTSEMPRAEVLGKIILESMLVAIGVSVGTAQLGSPGSSTGASNGVSTDRAEREHGISDDDDDAETEERPHVFKQFVLSYCGAVLLAANIAPTEEIVVIAADCPTWKLLGLVAVSLAIGALILYFSAFRHSGERYPSDGPLSKLADVGLVYGIALIASAMLLWFFGRFEDVSFAAAIAQTIVLGFAANLGASAGRLLIE